MASSTGVLARFRARVDPAAWWLAELPRWSRIGLIGAFVAYLGAAGYSFLTLVWAGSGDSYFHLDYAYQVWHGHLPAGYGSQLTLFDRGPTPATVDYFHYTAAHPPLVYAILAPIVGPLIDAGHPVAAVVGARLVNLAFGTATVAVVAWFGWRFGGRMRERLVVALPALAVLTNSFLAFSGDVYNDIVLTFFSTAAIAVGALVIVHGSTPRRLALLGVICAAGMASKATFVVTLVAVVGGIVIATVRARDGGRLAAAWRSAIARAAIVAGVPAIAIGWFYAYNYSRSGVPFRATPVAPLLGRHYKDMSSILTDSTLYLTFPRGLLGTRAWEPGGKLNWLASLALVCAGILAAATFAVVRRRLSGFRVTPTAIVGAVLVAQLVGLYLAQLEHATGYGAFNFRYFLPATLSIGYILGWGWLAWGRLTSLAIPMQMAVLVAGSVGSSVFWLARNRYDDVSTGFGFDLVAAGARLNGIPAVVPWALLAVSAAGIVVVAEAISRLSATEPRARVAQAAA